MGKNHTSSFIGKFTLYCGLGLFLITVYSNCSSHMSSLPNASVDSPENQQYFSKIARAHFSPESCLDEEAWSCLRRIVSPENQFEEKLLAEEESQECASLDGESFCPNIKNLFFDSSMAIEKCEDCSEKEISSRYDMVEYQCSNRSIRVEGIDVARGSGPNLQEAMTNAFAQCHNLFDGGHE